jgi:hypothetical protein
MATFRNAGKRKNIPGIIEQEIKAEESIVTVVEKQLLDKKKEKKLKSGTVV